MTTHLPRPHQSIIASEQILTLDYCCFHQVILYNIVRKNEIASHMLGSEQEQSLVISQRRSIWSIVKQKVEVERFFFLTCSHWRNVYQRRPHLRSWPVVPSSSLTLVNSLLIIATLHFYIFSETRSFCLSSSIREPWNPREYGTNSAVSEFWKIYYTVEYTSHPFGYQYILFLDTLS